jgi:hypothetical protein
MAMKKLVIFWCCILGFAIPLSAQTGAVSFGPTNPVVMWDAATNFGVAGYLVKYGVVNGTQTNIVDVQAATQVKLQSLALGKTNFIYVNAYNAQRTESRPSAQVYYYPLSGNVTLVTTDTSELALPTVAVTSPANGGLYTNISTLSVSAEAMASNSGTEISKIEYFQGATKIGETAGSGSITWSGVPTGILSLWALATDSLGLNNHSATNTIAVYAYALGDLTAPLVSLSSPLAGQVFRAGQPVSLAAYANAGDGSISKVEYYLNNTLLATATNSAGYPASWTPTAAGVYKLTARAYTAALCQTECAPVSVTVFANQPPAVTVNTPANGASIGYTLPVTLKASATDTDPGDSVAKTEIYLDGVLVGGASDATCVAPWTSPASGNHTVYAKAYDQYGASGYSPTNKITIQTPVLGLYLHLDGNLQDSSGNVLPVTARGTVPFAVGMLNQAAQFSAGNYLTVDTVAPLDFGSLDFTAEAWINPSSQPVSGEACVWSRASKAAGGLWLIYSATGAVLQWGDAFSAPVSLALHQWHHLAAVRQGSTLTLYADGARLGTTNYEGGLLTSTGAAQVGGYNGERGFAGLIDELRITLGMGRYSGATYSIDMPPVVVLDELASDTVYATNTVRIRANATAVNGISRVDLLTNGVVMTSVASGALAYDWVNPPLGTFAIQAKAVDAKGYSAGSVAAALTVVDAPVQAQAVAPTVALTSPASGQLLLTGKAVALAATASAKDEAIAKVEFYANGVLVATATGAAPYTGSWTPSTAGSYALFARAWTESQTQADSSLAILTVIDNHAPVAQVVSPADGASIGYGYSVTLRATAADVDQSDNITLLELYLDGILINTATAGSCQAAWVSPTSGNHKIYARAVDAYGLSAYSATNRVTVQTPQLAFYLRCDGDFQDSGANTLPVSANGAVPFAVGVANQAAQFTANHYLTSDAAAALALASLDFTVEAWVNLQSQPESGRACIWSHANEDAGGLWLTFAPGAVSLQWAGGLAAELPLTGNPWHHVAAVRQGGTLALYADGNRLAAADFVDSLPASAGSVQIGAYNGASGFPGLIDELKITTGMVRYSGATYVFNPPPVVTLSSPSTGTASTTNTIHIVATATDDTGIARIDLLTNGVVMTTVNSGSLSCYWSKPAAGVYAIQARAVDTKGLAAGSSIATLTVAANANQSPTVALSSPALLATALTVDTVRIAAAASDTDDGVAQVFLLTNGVVMASANGGSISADWGQPPVGTHTIQAMAVDTKGATAYSALATLTVKDIVVAPTNAPTEDASATLSFSTSLRVKSLEPTTNVVIGSMSPFIQWNAASSPPYVGYFLYLISGGTTNKLNIVGLINEVRLTNLMPAQVYSIFVTPYTSTKAEGKPSNLLQYQAEFEGPSALQMLNQGVSDNLVSGPSNPTLTWQASPETSISGYYLNYGNVGGITNRFSVGNTNCIRVSNLTPGKKYFFFVTAYHASGAISRPSNVMLYQPNATVAASVLSTVRKSGLKSSRHDTARVFQFSVAPGAVYHVQVSTDLKVWTTVETFESERDGEHRYTDPESIDCPARFYRAVVEPLGRPLE